MKALITGITGQDGYYLSHLLLSKGYEVHGIIRRNSSENYDVDSSCHLHFGDLSDAAGLRRIIAEQQPDELYNLAAQSHVMVSFESPEYTANINGMGVLRILEAIKDTSPKTKMYQASTSEMFGESDPPHIETTTFRPQSPYACAKVYAYHQTVNFRNAYGLFVCNGILFNHESPRRGERFVTRKIAKAVARISEGLQNKLYLGRLDAKRDWGWAPDYVVAMWLMLQSKYPDDYVIATGESHTVEEFVSKSFEYVGLDWKEHTEFDESNVRPRDVPILLGNAGKAKEKLGWEPTIKLQELISLMVEAEISIAKEEKKNDN